MEEMAKPILNPWSINLYNEEINIIFDSGGMIGIILDQRILGAQKVKGEYFDRNELKALLGETVEFVEGIFQEDEPFVFEDEEERTEELSLFNKRMHLRHICNTILHAVKIGGERAWKQLCIGSDMDGLIDPVNNCTSSEQFPDLEKDLVNMLQIMILEGQQEDPTVSYFGDNMESKVRDIMYNNGLRFLQTHFV